jgi:hypothetical protein
MNLGYLLHVDHHRLHCIWTVTTTPCSLFIMLCASTAREQHCWELCDVCPHTCISQGASLCKYLR